MNRILIIDGHKAYPFAEGRLTQTLIERMSTFFTNRGDEVAVVAAQEDYDIERQLELHRWADTVIVQMPVNWMGVPWVFKKYMDDVYTAGMGGALCHGDGRDESAPKANYGTGGTLSGTRYMMSLTFNTPEEAFNRNDEFFNGKSVDDLLFPQHMNFKFFDMTALPTFACFDVMKNADIENDLVRLDTHLATVFQR
ncbi:NAD(P)H-dependent oxidoreductase [Salinibius halmophilus]|uniref:NAD(P)H-dependent oxidoreductase n=1 Tax=Salinibius halmophilus TaxID=1853216 RepID=UPI000E6612D7|nr:NAD(P)H-dependent oxidoreductase [Salinibius halmophilus]